MKNTTNISVVFSLILLLSLESAFARVTCSQVFSRRPAPELFASDLEVHYRNEISRLNPEQIARLNEKTMEEARVYEPPRTAGRAREVDVNVAHALIRHMTNHPVVSPWQTSKYQPPGVEIGYCFGRAMFAHLMLLKMGVQKESIRKVWAVGPMKTGSIVWGFHVATAVYTKDGWMTIDTNAGHPQRLTDWMRHYGAMGTDKSVRYYFTPAEKFSLNLGKYDRVQLGLDMRKDQDWYRHYFADLVKSVRETDPAKLGLRVEKRDGVTVYAPAYGQQQRAEQAAPSARFDGLVETPGNFERPGFWRRVWPFGN